MGYSKEEDLVTKKVHELSLLIDKLYDLRKEDKSFYYRNKVNDEIIDIEQEIKWYTGYWYYHHTQVY